MAILILKAVTPANIVLVEYLRAVGIIVVIVPVCSAIGTMVTHLAPVCLTISFGTIIA